MVKDHKSLGGVKIVVRSIEVQAKIIVNIEEG